MNDWIIRNGRVIDPARQLDAVADLALRDGRIAEIGAGLAAGEARVFDARGLAVCPAFVDLHVHLREPGFEESETIETGANAAAAGGFGTIVAMANTNPPVDCPETLDFVRARAARARVRVLSVAALTRGLDGAELTAMEALRRAGAAAFSDDGKPLMSNAILRQGLERAAALGAVILDHCGDGSLAAGGVMNEGEVSRRLNVPGIPACAESVQAARDVALAASTGGRMHIQHISSRLTAEFAAFAKERGIGITAEATPHHLALCDEALAEWGANAKMNPPLAARSERDWLRKATAQGLIDCIATDHAPHAARLKNQGLAQAPFGIIGLETAFAVVHTVLVDSGLMDLPRLIALMTFRPARILGLSAGTLAPGAAADVAILDPNWSGSIGDSWLHSKSRNTPFLGYRARGRVAASFVGGRLVFREGALAE